MRYLSVCSGIEAATQAWHPLRWQPVAFSEIEPFPSAVLAHHYPTVPNYGDMTRFEEWPDEPIDLLCGGTPCQSFSVAGLRKGLADPRGNLMLTFGAIAGRYRPRWLVWENVPGVLSSNGGRDFGAFLGMLGELGYGFAYRVLDAQHVRTHRFPFAVPQRRRRVWLVGYLGDWRRAALVLFDRESLSGHPAPRREAGKAAPTIPARSLGGGGLGTDFDCDGGLIAANSGSVGYCLTASAQNSLDAETETLIAVAHALRGEGFDASEDGTGRGTPIIPVEQPFVLMERGRADGSNLEFRQDGSANAILTPNGGRGGFGVGAVAFAIQERAVSENPDAGPDGAGFRQDGASYTLEARTVPQAVAFDASEDGTGRGTPLVPVAFGAQNSATQGDGVSFGYSPTLDKSKTPAVAFDLNQITSKTNRSIPNPWVHHTLPASTFPPHLAMPWAVRRLTPRECERLQGFPDDFTAIPWRGKPASQCPDGPRYKALGNSWAVNCAEWIGERIAAVDAIPHLEAAE
ncbi:DNA cytosine methyltransferase [Haematobacter massiliensis]|uniref:DNA cytosine methyltransferase n=1 Tax=Haematobacter massiliensis TaxID=195105 RepID=UPI00054D6C91|nr:DNA cytosine methyltransferase [Haematobacter massiliensis]OWJ82727.1 DNA (cytosine-5-)-methyltransferase [Haematobacter massiliensis]